MTIDLDPTLRMECPAQEKWQGITSEYPTAKKKPRGSAQSHRVPAGLQPSPSPTSLPDLERPNDGQLQGVMGAALLSLQAQAPPCHPPLDVGLEGLPPNGPVLPLRWPDSAPPRGRPDPRFHAGFLSGEGGCLAQQPEPPPDRTGQDRLPFRPGRAGGLLAAPRAGWFACGCSTSWSHPPCEGGLALFPVCIE